MLRIGMSSCGFTLTEENFAALSENGISDIEISMLWDKYPLIDYKKTKELSDKYAVNLWSFHLPYDPFKDVDPSSLDKDLRDRTFAHHKAFIEKASDIGINKFIIHPSAEPIPATEREERLKMSMESMDRYAEFAATLGAVICVEDLPRTCLGHSAEDMKMLLSANDKLRVVFDTNHLLDDTNMNLLDAVGDKIASLHVSDYDFLNERHWLPGEGDVNWQELYKKLIEVGYNGVWMYEVGMKTPPTIVRPRELTFADFRNNAISIFEGKAPEAIGKRVDGLTSWK